MTVSNKLLAALLLSMVLTPVSDTYAANTVPTKEIIVPEEKTDTVDPGKEEVQTPLSDPSPDPAPEPDPDEVLDKTIPDDALPTIDLGSDNKPAEPTQTPDPNAKPSMDGELPEIITDFSKLPDPVRRMRELILDAAKSGGIEKLRALIGVGDSATTLSLDGSESDPIELLKEASGDNAGFEILAILIEVLEAGYVHLDAGTESEMYVWPYFFAWPLDKLSPQQMVELFRILTAGDVQDSQEFGAYVFYRVGIKPDGQWNFFVAGD